MKHKHKLAKLLSGGYNYRGYCMYRLVRANKLRWVVRDFDEERDWAVARTLAEMRRKIDRHERKSANTTPFA